MSIFLKHEVKENEGRYEAILYLDKRRLDPFGTGDFNLTIKNEAISYIKKKIAAIPIEVVRIMTGPIPYFSFAMINYQK